METNVEEQRAFSAGWPVRWWPPGRRKAAGPGNRAQELKGLGFVLRPSASSIG